jgi:HSP20 family protein
MRFFADDYETDSVERAMKTVRGSLFRYELLHIYTKPGWRPALDLYENGEGFVVLVDLAGINAEDVEITVAKMHVQVRGHRCRPSEHEVTRIHHMEIDFGSFEQSITLPEAVDPNAATSNFRDGFLLIRLPKEAKMASSTIKSGND